jgi:hypothetical protein
MRKALAALCGMLVSFPAWAEVTPPTGVTMGPNPYPKPSFNPGEYNVVVSKVPEERMNVIRYIWVEDQAQGLGPTVEKLKNLPCVVFKNVSRVDAERIVQNLTYLKCTASFERRKDQEVPNKASQSASARGGPRTFNATVVQEG